MLNLSSTLFHSNLSLKFSSLVYCLWTSRRPGPVRSVSGSVGHAGSRPIWTGSDPSCDLHGRPSPSALLSRRRPQRTSAWCRRCRHGNSGPAGAAPPAPPDSRPSRAPETGSWGPGGARRRWRQRAAAQTETGAGRSRTAATSGWGRTRPAALQRTDGSDTETASTPTKDRDTHRLQGAPRHA